jgi:hypothetical protein
MELQNVFLGGIINESWYRSYKAIRRQLMQLNHEVVARVKILQQKESYKALAKFNIGDYVSFDTNMGPIKGVIVKLNKKTATLHSDDHQHYNVSPQLLKKISGQRMQNLGLTNILSLQR